jgi:hypothetical protein
MDGDPPRIRILRGPSKMVDEPFLHRRMSEVEVVVPDDNVELAAGRNESSERCEELRMRLRDRPEPLDAGGNGRARTQSRIESGQIEHVSEDHESDPGTPDCHLSVEVVDETCECARRAVLVRGRLPVLPQMEVTDNNDGLAADDRYVRVPTGAPSSSSTRSSSHRRAAGSSQFATEKTKVRRKWWRYAPVWCCLGS